MSTNLEALGTKISLRGAGIRNILRLYKHKKSCLLGMKDVLIFLKGTLMEIWKSPYMFVFIYKYYRENFAFLILVILELHTRKVCKIFVYKHTETLEYIRN